MKLAPITVAVHMLGRDSRQELIEDVRVGLTSNPKSLPSRWFYDERGSQLFEEITRLPEYYLTRTEKGILERHARDIVRRTASASIVELGAGSCTKSRVLIRAAKGMGTLWTFVPMDISESTLRNAASQLAEEFDDLSVYCVTGDFDHHLAEIPRFGSQLLVFLGSTIGNFDWEQSERFLTQVRQLMQPGDHFLLGVDLVKSEEEMVAAYDDAQGVTARFNSNLLARINRELGADFDLGAFQHVAIWNGGESRIEIHLRSDREQTVRVSAANIAVKFDSGELMRTELCTKYTTRGVERLLEEAGMEAIKWYRDGENRFGLVLAR